MAPDPAMARLSRAESADHSASAWPPAGRLKPVKAGARFPMNSDRQTCGAHGGLQHCRCHWNANLNCGVKGDLACASKEVQNRRTILVLGRLLGLSDLTYRNVIFCRCVYFLELFADLLQLLRQLIHVRLIWLRVPRLRERVRNRHCPRANRARLTGNHIFVAHAHLQFAVAGFDQLLEKSRRSRIYRNTFIDLAPEIWSDLSQTEAQLLELFGVDDSISRVDRVQSGRPFNAKPLWAD